MYTSTLFGLAQTVWPEPHSKPVGDSAGPHRGSCLKPSLALETYKSHTDEVVFNISGIIEDQGISCEHVTLCDCVIRELDVV